MESNIRLLLNIIDHILDDEGLASIRDKHEKKIFKILRESYSDDHKTCARCFIYKKEYPNYQSIF